jgi:TM2 domain-containing membrane protein YozV
MFLAFCGWSFGQVGEIQKFQMKPLLGGRGSGGNVVAALASLFLPGLGQLTQGRITSAVLQFLLAGVLWILSFGLLGWVGHVLACLDAALWTGSRK